MVATLPPQPAWLASALLLLATANVLIAEQESTNAAALPQVQLLGAPTRYAVDVERYRPRATSNNPNPGAKAAYADELQATAHASGIEVIRDDPEASILRLELEPDSVEWVAFNPGSIPLTLAGQESRQPLVYLHHKRP